ncbi:MAG: fructosamine kinase family protein, partial [Pseudomonadota bacterium]
EREATQKALYMASDGDIVVIQADNVQQVTNAASDETGQPVIYDPASYYGHREAEFGMMRLFGGFTADCEAAYQEVWPLAGGYEERIPVYRLYHELNHLNLFGAMYHSQCVATLRSLV